jgi:hypothetical protein
MSIISFVITAPLCTTGTYGWGDLAAGTALDFGT